VGKTKERRKERGRGKEARGERVEKKEKKNPRKERAMKVKKVAEEWEIWDDDEETAKSEKEAKWLVPKRFHKWIHIFGKKTSERMPTRKLLNHTIDMKKGFVPRKEKVYSLSREEREKVHEFISKQLRKGYIRPSKSTQMAPVFFVGKKNGKRCMIQDYRYLNK